MKDAKSYRVSPNITSVLLYQNQDFSANLSHTQCCVHYLLALEACETFYDPLLIKAAQPENLFSLEVFFLYISNLFQPQKVSNKVTFSPSKGVVSYNKERTN